MVNTGPTYPLPQRTPMDHLARWGMPPSPDQVPHVTDPAAYRSPGRPPWHVPPARALRASMVGWVAVAVMAVLAICGGLALIVGPVDSGVPATSASEQADSVGPVDAGPPAAETVAPKTDGYGEGTYAVGEDIKAGTYKTVVPADAVNCYWARLKNFDGVFGSISDNGNLSPGGRGRVVVKKSDAGVEFAGQCVWKRTGP